MKKNNPKFSLLIIVLVFLAGLIGGIFLRETPPLSDPENAIVRVSTYGPSGPSEQTGFLIQNDYILTTTHGLEEVTDNIYVSIPGKGDFSSALVTKDSVTDLTLLKLTANYDPLPSLVLGDSDKLKVGQAVLTTEGKGSITHLSRSISAGKMLLQKDFDGLLEFKAPVLTGNSGGPLLNLQGEVIGMIVAVSLEEENLGFAIPINTVKDFLEESIEIK